MDTDVSLEQAEGSSFRIVMIHFDSEGCGAGFLPKFEKMAKEALKPYRISITMTLLDPFYLILLLGSEKEKRWKEMEPVLVDALKSCTQDGSISGMLFYPMEEEAAARKTFCCLTVRQRKRERLFPGLDGGKSVCLDDVPPEKPWIDDAKKQRDKFYQLIMDNDEKRCLLFQKTLYLKTGISPSNLCMNF